MKKRLRYFFPRFSQKEAKTVLEKYFPAAVEYEEHLLELAEKLNTIMTSIRQILLLKRHSFLVHQILRNVGLHFLNQIITNYQ